MRIKEIQIKGLFDMFDHTIPLNLDSHITIIYGINGIGKTMLFKILEFLFKKEFFFLANAPFKSIKLIFDDNNFLEVTNSIKKLSFLYDENKSYELNIKIKEDIFKEIEKNNNFVRIEKAFFDRVSQKYFQDSEVLDNFKEYIPQYNINNNSINRLLDETQLFFIKTQRINTFVNSRLEGFYNSSKYIEVRNDRLDTVFQYSSELFELINDKHNEYNQLSEKLEGTLGNRILKKEIKTDFTNKELKELIRKVETKKESLKSVGILEGIENKTIEIKDDLDDISKAIIAVNIQDMDYKFKIFEDIYSKLMKFLDLVNKRLSFKKMYIKTKISSPYEDKGFVFVNEKGVNLSSKDLSSGEQNEIILLYDLIFKIPDNSLILIDEPEISLHIVWQKEFLDDLEDILNFRDFDLIISTHSPAIINGNWDLTVSLKGNSKDE